MPANYSLSADNPGKGRQLLPMYSRRDSGALLQKSIAASLQRIGVSDKAFPDAAGQLVLRREISRPAIDRNAVRSRSALLARLCVGKVLERQHRFQI